MKNEIENFILIARDALSSEIRFNTRILKSRELTDGDVFIHNQRLLITESNQFGKITTIEVKVDVPNEEWEWQFDTVEKDSNCTVIGYISDNHIQELLYYSREYSEQLAFDPNAIVVNL